MAVNVPVEELGRQILLTKTAGVLEAVTTPLAVTTQLLSSVTVTLYVPPDEVVMEEVVVPVFQIYVEIV